MRQAFNLTKLNKVETWRLCCANLPRGIGIFCNFTWATDLSYQFQIGNYFS